MPKRSNASSPWSRATPTTKLAHQRWEGERIAEETFFYDPAQRTPVKVG
ncbi:MAG TPA: hypothetical protein VGI10_20620 [Polyangiaceae bacterium]